MTAEEFIVFCLGFMAGVVAVSLFMSGELASIEMRRKIMQRLKDEQEILARQIDDGITEMTDILRILNPKAADEIERKRRKH